MKKISIGLSVGLFVFPLFAFAANLDNVKNLVGAFGDIVDSLIPILIALALVVFFWGLVKYVWSGGGEEAKKTGKSIMIAGLVSLFVMVSVWGIITLAQNALGVAGTSVDIPCPPGEKRVSYPYGSECI